MDFLDHLDDSAIVLAPKAEIVVDRKVADIQKMEDDIFRESMAMILASARFADFDPSLKDVPASWISEYGSLAEAEKAFRIAKYALMSAKEAPVAMKLAAQMVTGIVKARAVVRQGPRNLNVTFIKMAGTEDNTVDVEIVEVDR